MLLAGASSASAAASDMIEDVRDGEITPTSNIICGDTAIMLADSLRLLIDAMPDPDEETTQLHGAVSKFLDDTQ